MLTGSKIAGWVGRGSLPGEATGTLIGRERELRALDTRLGAVRDHGIAVLIRGQAGVGKSSLLAAAVDRAETEGMRVLTVSGVRSEAHLAFAGLHQLLRPLLDRAHGLPRSQRDALLATFGLGEVSAPDTFLITLAALELLADAATETPLLVAVDDAHWLDASTAAVLGFVARRLNSEPVALLMAVRDGYETPLVEFDLPELRVGPLDDLSSSVLLDSLAPGLGPELRSRVLAAAAGNPLALVELPTAVDVRPSSVSALPERLPITTRLKQALVERFFDLPLATRTVLLVASVDEEAHLSEILTAAGLLGENGPAAIGDLAPAVASGLVGHDFQRISFCHPLLAAAIYLATASVQRHQAHAALAATLIDYPDRRAWHLAASTTIPDENVAAELERASMGATPHGSASISLALIERAAELTPDTSRRGRRLLYAAELAVDLGQLDRAHRLLGEIDPTNNDPLDRARMGLLRDMIEPGLPADRKAVESLVDAATRASSVGDIDLALRLLQAAAVHGWWADPGLDVRMLVIVAAKRVAAPENDPRVLAILAIFDPAGSAARLSHVASCITPDSCDSNTAYCLGTALHATGAFELSAAFLAAAVTGLRDRDRLWLLAQALALQAWTATFSGNWDMALAAANEATELARQTRQPMWVAAAKTAQSMIAVIRGHDDLAESLLGEAEAIALPLGASAVLSDILAARAFIALGGGRYVEAFEHLRRTFDPHDPAHHPVRSAWRIGEYAEAAVHAGRIDEAREQLAESEGLAQLSLSPRLRMGLLYARPLLADDDDTVEDHFQTALKANLTVWPFHRARLLLEYGTWLRRHRKIAQARMPLRAALDSFVALGAAPWAARTRQELRAARETRRHQPEAWTQLTEQELQIAHLAAQGLSNREIAQRLYISHRTVGAHLYRIYPKLEVASRAQLQAVIGNCAPTTLAS